MPSRVVIGRGGRHAARDRDLLQCADVRRGRGRATAGHLLLDTVAFAVVEVLGGARGRSRRVLPAGEPSLVVPGQLLAGGGAARAGRAATGRATTMSPLAS